MKKLIYSLAFIALGLVGCTNFDDAVTENYGDGPAISINITATTDSAFTFTLTPAEGTQFYNFIIDESDEAEELDASALLQGQYGNDGNVRKAADAPTTTLTIDAEPNTTYQIYAVAASDKGIVGKVAVASVTTTDANAPALVKNAFEPVPEKKSVIVSFDQNLIRGEGAVTGIYYKEWDWDNPVTIDPADITVEIDGKDAILSAPETPDGAIVIFSWAAGAFVDAFGNKCGAFTTTYDEAKDDFIGAAVQNKKVAFEIADTCFVDAKTSFKDAEAFRANVAFEFNIYRIDEEVKDGDVCVSFLGEKKATVFKLSADDWEIKDEKVISVKLPQGIEDGDKVYVSFAEGAFYDVYGNPNAEYNSNEVWWKYVTFAPTVEDVIGDFTYYVTLKSDGKTYKVDNFSISEYTGEDAEPGDVIISGLYLDDSEIFGYYDLQESKLYIQRYQYLGSYEEDGTTYGVLTYSASNQKWIEFDITEDGIISTDFGLVYTDAEVTEILGQEIPAGTTSFIKAAPATPEAARTVSNFGQKYSIKKYANTIKSLKGSPKTVKNVRARK